MFSKTLDYSYTIDQTKTTKKRSFNGLTLLFVVDGRIKLVKDEQTLQLGKGEMFIIHPNEYFSLVGVEPNIVFSLSLHTSYLLQYLPDFFSYTFNTYEPTLGQGRKKMLHLLQKNLAELGLMCDELNHPTPYQRLTEENTMLHILQLLERFFKFPNPKKELQPITNERIQTILNYLESHYTEKISLHELADKEYISTSYLSRIFKKQLGISFTQYLQELRLKHALLDLIHTNQPIEQIALKNGFSDVKSFRELTKQIYGVAPITYRKNHQQPSEQEVVQEQKTSFDSPTITKIVSALSMYSKRTTVEDIWQESDSEKILITPQTDPKPVPEATKLLKIGQISELLKKSSQDMILQTNHEISFDYLVIQDFFTDDIILPDMKTDEHISTYLRYSDLDACLQFIQMIKKPLFLVLSPWKEEETAENMEKLQLLFRHIHVHFDDDFCRDWKIVYDYSQEQSQLQTQRWQRQLEQIRHHCRLIETNLSFGTYVQTEELTEQFLHKTTYARFLQEINPLIDFYTCNSEPNQKIQESLLHQKYIQTDDAVEELKTARQVLQKEQLLKPFYLMHWNTLTGNTRLTNGIFFRGALILKTAMTLGKYVAGTGVWLNTELFHKYDPFHQLIDGLELFNYEELKRPAYFALALKNRLQGTILAKAEHYVLTQTKTGYQLLLFNPNYLNPFLSLEDWLVAKQRKEFFVTIQGLEAGFYQIKKFTFDYQHGAVYRQMADLSTMNGADQEMIRYIRQMTHPQLEVFDESVEPTWSFYANLDINAIQLFELKKIDLSYPR